MTPACFQSDIQSLKLLNRGKVRDIYEVDAQRLLIVTTDRLSAFDVVMQDPIPSKGLVLTAVSNFWFEKLKHILPNQLTGDAPESVVTAAEAPQVTGRALVVKKLKPLPIEAIVRGYLVGSGWKEYQKTGSVCGIALPAGLREADKLPQVLFTPSTKAELGQHDWQNKCVTRQLLCTKPQPTTPSAKALSSPTLSLSLVKTRPANYI